MQAINNMITAILIIFKTSYMSDQNIKCQIEENNKKTYRFYIWLIDIQFFILMSKLIQIIDYILKFKN